MIVCSNKNSGVLISYVNVLGLRWNTVDWTEKYVNTEELSKRKCGWKAIKTFSYQKETLNYILVLKNNGISGKIMDKQRLCIMPSNWLKKLKSLYKVYHSFKAKNVCLDSE